MEDSGWKMGGWRMKNYEFIEMLPRVSAEVAGITLYIFALGLLSCVGSYKVLLYFAEIL
jgi:hypothetical protein